MRGSWRRPGRLETEEGQKIRRVRTCARRPDEHVSHRASESHDQTVVLKSQTPHRDLREVEGGRPGLPRTAEGELQPVHAALFTLPLQKGE